MLYFQPQDLAAALPELLRAWPEQGCRTDSETARVAAVADRWPDGLIRINPAVDRAQVRRAANHCIVRTATAYSTPWRFQKLFTPNVDIRKQALKLRVGATVPISLAGNDTTALVKKARRLRNFRGKPYYLQLELNVNTEHIPVILDRETKCQCVFCGTDPAGDEESCRACGAPLPSCG